MTPVVYEAEWKGKPTFLIAILDKDGTPVKALKWVESDLSSWTWVNRPEFGWHNPNREFVEEQLKLLLEKGTLLK